jgi:acyl carrier protein
MASDLVTPGSICEYINTAFSTEERTLSLTADDQLLAELDSMQVMRLVVELEAKYSIRFDNGDMTPDNLGSIARVTAFVNSKR